MFLRDKVKLKKLIRNILRESDFDWHIETPTYRFFDVYTCGDTQYDEETGEDECLDGGSYFLKIPENDVQGIWDYEVEDEYVAGPLDEGEGIIDWAINNEKIDPNEVAMFEYVREIDKKEFCMAVGGSYNHKDICGENNEIGKGIWVESTEDDSDWDFMDDIPLGFDPYTVITFNPPLDPQSDDDFTILVNILTELKKSEWVWNSGDDLLSHFNWFNSDVYCLTTRKSPKDRKGVTRSHDRNTVKHLKIGGYKEINGRELHETLLNESTEDDLDWMRDIFNKEGERLKKDKHIIVFNKVVSKEEWKSIFNFYGEAPWPIESYITHISNLKNPMVLYNDPKSWGTLSWGTYDSVRQYKDGHFEINVDVVLDIIKDEKSNLTESIDKYYVKNIIKKILRESNDDFEWIRDVNIDVIDMMNELLKGSPYSVKEGHPKRTLKGKYLSLYWDMSDEGVEFDEFRMLTMDYSKYEGNPDFRPFIRELSKQFTKWGWPEKRGEVISLLRDGLKRISYKP